MTVADVPFELRILAGSTLVTADDTVSVPQRALDFLVRATRAGGDATFVRHRTNGFLVSHGYPWLRVLHRHRDEYTRALVACLPQGDGNLMASTLLKSVTKGSDNE
ncbi:hypothetical protein [Rathayibacter iranicus]|uniref:hypothetical protein n=1 Tax=Rathayibacter iranicus TaxID=59737 RepID=UPI000FD86F0E|nr:hypothetical protein [Rathayibacter iranicus]MWV32225.1 hypothetical protein [Rathayibacter iranicus NCPPB 2253 = VKM Ac-1602]